MTAETITTESDLRQAALALADALAIVRAAGYVPLREKSYHQAQERQRMAEVRAECEEAAAEHARVWAMAAFDEQRRLGDRLTFVYGVARSLGASIEDLAGVERHRA